MQNPSVLFQGIQLKYLKAKTGTDICTPYSYQHYSQSKRWNQHKCPSANEWINIMQYIHNGIQFNLYQFSSVAHFCPTLCDPMDCSMLGFPVHHQFLELFKLMSIQSVMPSNYLILCHPILLLLSVFPSIRVFSNESVLCIRWPKYWSFSFSISLSNEYSGLISFRIDWFDLLSVQGTLKNLLQHHSSKAPIVWCSTLLSNSHIHTWSI